MRAIAATRGYGAVAVVTESHLPGTVGATAAPEGRGGGQVFSAPRLSALVATPAAAASGEEEAVWAALASELPELWWAARPAASHAESEKEASEASQEHEDCMRHDRCLRWASGVVRLATEAEAATLDGLPQEEQLALMGRAAAGGEVLEQGQSVNPPATVSEDLLAEGFFMPSGGGHPFVNGPSRTAGTPPQGATGDVGGARSPALRHGPALMWWGLLGLFEAEEALQTAQRARAIAVRQAEALQRQSDASSRGGSTLSGLNDSALARHRPTHPADDVAPAAPAADATPAASSAAPVFVARESSRRVALVGARGYTGRELVSLIAQHPQMVVSAVSSRAFAGQSVAGALAMDAALAERACTPGLTFEAIAPEDIAAGGSAGRLEGTDAFVLALPNGHADRYHQAIRAAHPEAVVVDLSADKRFDDTWAYGMPERRGARPLIQESKDISNPGCYATGVQVGLMPFVTNQLLDQQLQAAGSHHVSFQPDLLLHSDHIPSAFGISGYSGAGVTPSDKNDPAVLRDNILPYALTGHIHESEVSRHIGRAVSFSPHVAPFFRGISVTLSGMLADPEEAQRRAMQLAGSSDESLTEEERAAAAAAAKDEKSAVQWLAARQASEYFANEPLVRVMGGPIDVRRHGSNCSGVAIGGFSYDPNRGRLAWTVCLDNLGKGAAVQALQNLNLALGLPELSGITPDQ